LWEVTLAHLFNDIFIILTDFAKIYKQNRFIMAIKREKNDEGIEENWKK
jgi:hypothetical protein